jgi:hypothetical protein
MALMSSRRPLKRWRYAGVFDDDVMLCAGIVRVGPFRQVFWAVWDRRRQRLFERTRLTRGRVALPPGTLRIAEPDVQADITIEEDAGVEVVCANGRSYVWTRKQGGIRARGHVVAGGERIELGPRARGVVDETAGYHQRITAWDWSAGVGVGPGGEELAWNLVSGVNDPPELSERTVWVDGVPREVGPVQFSEQLDRIAGADGAELRFASEAVRERRDRLGPFRSDYRQPFGRFEGVLPGGVALAAGLGVTERHLAHW